jgi:hypothetical protein
MSGPGTRDVAERPGPGGATGGTGGGGGWGGVSGGGSAMGSAGAATGKGDGYIDRLIKYIPAEIIALYLGVVNVIPSPLGSHKNALWTVSAISAICVPVYMYLSTRQDGHGALWPQVVISSAAFPLWVFAIGGPFAQYSWYDGYRWVGAVVICFATFLFGLYVPAPAPAKKPAAAAASAPVVLTP